MSANQTRLRRLALSIAVATVYAASAVLSSRFALVSTITPIWIPMGVAVGALVVWGRRLWPSILIGGAFFEFLVGTPPEVGVMKTLGGVIAAVAMSWALEHTDFTPRFSSMKSGAVLVIVGTLGTTISASVGTSAMAMGGLIAPTEVVATFWVWWAGDAMGVVLVAPFLMSVRLLAGHQISQLTRHAAEVLPLTTAAILVTAFVVGSGHPLLFALVPFVVGAAYRWEIYGAATVGLAIAITATLLSDGITGTFAAGDLPTSMARLLAFNATIAITGTIFAGLVTEKRRNLAQNQVLRAEATRLAADRAVLLDASQMRLRDAQIAGGVACWEVDMLSGEIIVGRSLQDLAGIDVSDEKIDMDSVRSAVHPDDFDRLTSSIQNALDDDILPDTEIRLVADDGTTRWFRLRGRPLRKDGGLRLVGTLTDIQSTRQAQDTERGLLESEIRRRQALDINEQIVRGLRRAAGSLKDGDAVSAQEAIEETHRAALDMVTDLIHPVRERGLSLDVGDILVPGAVLDLRRPNVSN